MDLGQDQNIQKNRRYQKICKLKRKQNLQRLNRYVRWVEIFAISENILYWHYLEPIYGLISPGWEFWLMVVILLSQNKTKSSKKTKDIHFYLWGFIAHWGMKNEQMANVSKFASNSESYQLEFWISSCDF